MLRRLFTVLSVLSLLLCVATCVLWVRSYRTQDRVEWRREGRKRIAFDRFQADLCRGVAAFNWNRITLSRPATDTELAKFAYLFSDQTDWSQSRPPALRLDEQ